MDKIPSERIEKIVFWAKKRDEADKELLSAIGGSSAKAAGRKVNDYSITGLLAELMVDGKARKVAQMAHEIKAKTGHEPAVTSIRSAAKYMAKQGKLYMNNVTKEFQLSERQEARNIEQRHPEPVMVSEPAVQ